MIWIILYIFAGIPTALLGTSSLVSKKTASDFEFGFLILCWPALSILYVLGFLTSYFKDSALLQIETEMSRDMKAALCKARRMSFEFCATIAERCSTGNDAAATIREESKILANSPEEKGLEVRQ